MKASDPVRTILETERLVLRYQNAADVAPLSALWSDPVVTKFMGGPRDKAWLVAEFGKTARKPRAEKHDLWPLIEKSTGTLVGHIGLLDKDVEGRAEIEIVYVLIKSAWGKGYATEAAGALTRHAFDSLKLDRLIALIDPDNANSERVAERLGMKFEKMTIRPDGEIKKLYSAGKE